MKKFFSLLCALAIVLGANAVPQFGKADKKVAINEKSLNLKAKATVKKAAKKAAPFQKLEAKAVKSQSNAALKARKANSFDLSFTSATDEVEWTDNCASEGWWQIQAESDAWYVSISNVNRETAAGTYAWEDLDDEYTCIYDIENGEDFIYFTDGSCTVAVDEDGNVTVEGTFTDEEGNTYHITIACTAPEPVVLPEGGDFEIVEIEESYYSSGNDVWVKLYDEDENTFRFDIVVGEGNEAVVPGVTYTLDDMLADYSYATVLGEKIAYVSASYRKTANEDGSADINASFVDANNNTWNLHYAQPAPPTAQSQESITAAVTYTSEAYWFWTLYTFKAADEHNSIELSLMPDDSFLGTWEAGDNGDISGAVTPVNGVASAIYSGSVTIAATEEGFKITGTVLCENSIEYTLDLTYTKPEATRQVELTLSGLEVNIFEGGWQLIGFNADSTTYITIAALADEVAGTYTDAELYADYSFIYTDIVWNEERTKVASYTLFSLVSANLTVAFDEETLTITGTFVGQNADDPTDVPEFTLNLSGNVPEPEVSDMTFQFADGEDGITVTPSNNEDAWDWYIADAATIEEFGSAQALAEAVYNSYGNQYAVIGEQLISWNDVALYTDGAAGTFYLIVWGSGANNMTTEASVHQFDAEEQEGSPYDSAEAFEIEFADYELDDQNLAQYHVLGASAEDEDGNYIYIEFNLASGATELAAGTYQIAETGAAGTVTTGSVEQYIYGSFAGHLAASGQISIPLWLFAEGTVTVAEDETIIVDALNTKGAAITVVLHKQHTAIDNNTVESTAAKFIENGQLFIEKSGKRYNVLGAVVK